MRIPLILVLVAASALASADTIYLKNGRSIVVDQATEADGRVQYEIGENSYAIPKSSVDRIEAGPGPKISTSSLEPPTPAGAPAPQESKEVPELTFGGKVPGGDALTSKIIHDDRVDADALSDLERTGDNELSAAGFFIAGRHEYIRGNREQARHYLERARIFAPDNPIILNHYAAVLIQLGRATEAISFALHSTRLAPNSADGFTVLGFAYYSANQSRDAVPAWKRSLELHPDEAVKTYLAKAEREMATEAEFLESETGHFTVRYEGATTSSVLRSQIQEALERYYDELVAELAIVPRNNISVSLYTQRAFFDVTQAPAWIGAMNDGKLRIPVQGLAAITPALGKVLKHELAHSFINQAARGRCPQWLNEGIAQLVEPKTVEARGRRLAQLYAGQHAIPLGQLESSFMSFSPGEAVLAYDEALAAAEYIRDTYGMDELRRILERIGNGASAEAAIRVTVRTGYAGLEQDLGRYLANKYGT